MKPGCPIKLVLLERRGDYPTLQVVRLSRLLGWAMSSYQPAVLIEMVENEPAGDEIEGEAVILISRNERGGMEASGTFRSADERLQDSKRLPKLLFQYEGG